MHVIRSEGFQNKDDIIAALRKVKGNGDDTVSIFSWLVVVATACLGFGGFGKW